MASNEMDSTCDQEEQARIVSLIIPPLSFNLHKGQAGRIGVIGGKPCKIIITPTLPDFIYIEPIGSKEYTGAPYFAAISGLKVGCDLAHVFCTSDAATVIKCYSPELIVHPVLDYTRASEEISHVLPRLHSLIIGPGLGRNPAIFRSLRDVILRAKELQLPMVFDADALHFLNSDLDLIRDYEKAILTPNAVEFAKLCETVGLVSSVTPTDPESSTMIKVQNMANMLGNVTIVLKNEKDVISNGRKTITCSETGSPRRCGGQGDLLAGSLGVFNYWSFKHFRNHEIVDVGLGELSAPMVSALGACLLTRRCSRMAFATFGRSMTTSDMIAQIQKAFSNLFTID